MEVESDETPSPATARARSLTIRPEVSAGQSGGCGPWAATVVRPPFVGRYRGEALEVPLAGSAAVERRVRADFVMPANQSQRHLQSGHRGGNGDCFSDHPESA